MSRVSVYKPAKAYKPRKLVQGFCVPTKEGSGERLLCWDCGVPVSIEYWYAKGAGVATPSQPVPVTYDGKVKCSRCGELLKGAK